MLEHTSASHPSQKTSAYPHSVPTSGVSEPLSTEVIERIQDYLDQVCAPLVKFLPYTEREERRREMEIHLESLTQAHIELGSDPLEAVSIALQQFGVSRSVQHEWKRVTAADLRQSLGVACALYGSTFALYALAMNNHIYNSLGTLLQLCLFLGLWSVPAGFGTGWLARRYPLQRAFAFQALCSFPVFSLNVYRLLWPRAIEMLQDRGIAPSLASILREVFSPEHYCLQVLGILVLTGAGSILAGSLAAGFGAWLRKQNRRLRQRLAL